MKPQLVIALRLAGVGLQFLCIVLAGYLLSKEEAGIYFMAYAWIVVVGLIARLGQEFLLLRELPALESARLPGYSLGWLIQVTGVGGLLACILAAVFWVASPLPVEPLYFFSGCLLSTTLALLLAGLQGLGKPLACAAVGEFLQPGLQAALLLSLSLSVGTDALMAYCYSAGLALAITLGVIASWWSRSAKGKVSYPGRKGLTTAVPLLVVSGSANLFRWIDSALFGLLMGPAVLAVYTPISQLSALVKVPNRALNGLFPQRAALAWSRGDGDSLGAMMKDYAGVSRSLGVLGAIACFSIYKMGAAHGFLPPETRETVMVLALLLLAHVISIIRGPLSYLLLMTDNEQAELKIVPCTLAVMAVLTVALVPPYGMVGAGIAAFASLALQQVLRSWSVASRLHIGGGYTESAMGLFLIVAVGGAILLGVPSHGKVSEDHTRWIVPTVVAALVWVIMTRPYRRVVSIR